MSLQDLMYEFEAKVEDYIAEHFKEVKAEELGLDNRGCYRLMISEDGIMVPAHSDRTMQYYGGFEYVDKDCRVEYGTNWVFYSAEDNRVRRHLSHQFENIQEYED